MGADLRGLLPHAQNRDTVSLESLTAAAAEGGVVELAQQEAAPSAQQAAQPPPSCAVPGAPQAVVDLPTPSAGERVAVDAHPGDVLRLSCAITGLRGAEVGDDLQLIHPNGGVVVINEFRQWAAAQDATLADCNCGRANLAEFIVALGLPPETLLPAAGGPGGPVANHPSFAPGPGPQMLGGYPSPNILPPTDLSYVTPTPTITFLQVETLAGGTPGGPPPLARDDIAVVQEPALPTGTNAASAAEDTTGNLLANDDTGGGGTIASIDGHMPDASGHIVITTASGRLDVDTHTGAYSYMLQHAGPATSDVFHYVLQNSSGQTSSAQLTVEIVDDAPKPVNDSASTTDVAPQDINLVIVFDRSGSMAENPGVPGYSTRFDLAKASTAALFEAYQSIAADLHIKIVDFASNTAHSAWLSSPEEANAYLAQLQATGGTRYANAIRETIDNYDTPADPLPAADRTEVYFISDGVPNPASSSLHSPGAAASVAEWESFLTANGIENAFAVGVGAGLTANDPDLGDVAFPNGPGGTEPNRLIITDESELLDTLVGTVATPVSGNVLTNDAFGADGKGNGGVGVVSIQVDGHTYTYNQAANEIRNEANALVVAGAVLAVDTTLGGQLQFHFGTGAYFYTPPNVTVTQTETFPYTIVDGDGSSAGASLQITVTDAGSNVVTPHIHIGTNGNDALDDSALTVDDIMSGGLGADTLTGGTGNDHIQGGTGNDLLTGGAGSDIMIGGQASADGIAGGNDTLAGGNDTLDGGAGSDQLFGGDGDDKLFAGAGDRAEGNAGNDLLVLQDNVDFSRVSGGSNLQNSLAAAGNRGDVLAFDGTLDLTVLAPGKIAGIETLSMKDSEGGGSHPNDAVTLNAGDVLELGSGRFDPTGSAPGPGALPAAATAKIDGDGPGDSVNLTGGGWSSVSGEHGAPAGYALYAHGSGAARPMRMRWCRRR